MSGRRGSQTSRVIIIASLTLLGLTFFKTAHAGAVTKRAETGRPIYVGQIVPLTGISVKPGIFEKAGPDLAVRQINAHGGIHGRPVRLIVVDDHSTLDGAIAAFSRLAGKHVAAIIGPGSSAEILAMSPYVRQAHTPMMIGGQAPLTTHEGNRWVFRTRPNSLVEAKVVATFAVKSLHLTRIAIIHPDDAGGLGQDAALRSNLKVLGVTPLTDQSFTPGAADLTAQVLAIKKSGANALLSGPNVAADTVLLARQMSQAGLHLTWLGNPALAGEETRLAGGKLLYGTYAVTDYVAGQSPEATAFDRLSMKELHLPGDFASAYAYDGVQILARVMRKVGTNHLAIRRGILALRRYRGAEGTYSFDRNGDGLRQDTIVRNVRGRLTVIKVLSF